MAPRKLILSNPRSISEVIRLVERFVGDAGGPDTLNDQEYRQVREWVEWSVARGYQAIPARPRPLSIYLEELVRRGFVYLTVYQFALSLAKLHLALGLDDPRDHLVSRTLQKIKREIGIAPRATASPLTRSCFDVIQSTVSEPRDGEIRPITIRNARRALAVIGVMRDAMLKPPEARAMAWEDIQEQADGSGLLTVRLKGGGDIEKFLSEETMSFVSRARDAGDLLPRQPQQLLNLIKWATQKAALDGHYTAWSPRLGMAIDLLDAGESIVTVMVEGRWQQFHQLPACIKKKLAELDGKRRERLLRGPDA